MRREAFILATCNGFACRRAPDFVNFQWIFGIWVFSKGDDFGGAPISSHGNLRSNCWSEVQKCLNLNLRSDFHRSFDRRKQGSNERQTRKIIEFWTSPILLNSRIPRNSCNFVKCT